MYLSERKWQNNFPKKRSIRLPCKMRFVLFNDSTMDATSGTASGHPSRALMITPSEVRTSDLLAMFLYCVLRLPVVSLNFSVLNCYGGFFGIMSLLRQSLLRLLILRQRPIVFAILTLLAIQMQYGTAHLTWKGHGFYPRVGSFFSYAALLFLKLFSAAHQNIFYKRKYYFM